MSAGPYEPQHYQLEVTGHVRDRWQERSRRSAIDPREAWREGEPVEYPGMKPPAKYARYHEPTDLVLLVTADHALTTVIPLWHRSQHEQDAVRSQVTDQ